MSTLKKKIINNGISTTLQKGVRILEQLILVPFFISSWGAAYYGEWLTLTIIPSVLAFSDLGLGSAAANSFVLKYSGGYKQEAANIARTGFIVITMAIVAGLTLGTIGLGVTTHFGWLQHSLIPTNQAIIALSFIMLATVLSFYMQIFEAYFRAARKAALGINLSTINGLLNILAGLIVLLLGYGIVAFAISQLLVAIVFNIAYGIIAEKTLHLYREHKGKFSKSEAKSILKNGLGYLMSPVWQSLLFQGTTFVVRVTLGPVAVAIFNTVRTLSRSVNQLYSIVNGSVFPEIQYEIGVGNMDQARKIFSKSIQISFLLSIVGVLLLAIFGLPAYNLWTKHELNPPYIMWFIFITATAFNSVWWTSGVVFRAMNKPYKLSIAGIVCSVIAIGGTYLGCELWGLTGAAIGSLFFEILMAVYILPVSIRLINLNPTVLIKK